MKKDNRAMYWLGLALMGTLISACAADVGTEDGDEFSDDTVEVGEAQDELFSSRMPGGAPDGTPCCVWQKGSEPICGEMEGGSWCCGLNGDAARECMSCDWGDTQCEDPSDWEFEPPTVSTSRPSAGSAPVQLFKAP